MKYLTLLALLLTGCQSSMIKERNKYKSICDGTNVKKLIEHDREVECYQERAAL